MGIYNFMQLQINITMKKIYFLFFLLTAAFSSNSQWTGNKKINTLVANANSSDIQTSNTSDGKTWIAFYSQRGANYYMRAQLLDVNGVRLLGDSGLVVSNKKSGSATYVFNVCVDRNDNLVIGFQFQQGSSTECILQKVTPQGNLPWGDGVDLGAGLSPYPATLTTNEIAVAWNNNGKINYQKVSEAGISAWQPAKIFTGNSGHIVSRSQVVRGTGGVFSMVYQDQFSAPFYTNLFVQRFDNNGNAIWSAARQIANLTTVSYRYYDVIGDGDTTYVGYYGNPSGSNRFDAYVQKINPGGRLPWGINGVAFADYSGANDPSEQTIYIAKRSLAPNIWAVCTLTNPDQTMSGVSAQQIDAATGNRTLGKNAKTVFPISLRLTSLAFANLVLPENFPEFLVTDTSNKLVATALKDDGSFLWPDSIYVLGGTRNSKFRYGLTQPYYGKMVAVWQEDKGNGDMPYAEQFGYFTPCGFCGDNPNAGNTNKLNAIAIKSIYPNPVVNNLSASINSSIQGNAKIYITDVSGNVLKQVRHNLLKGDNIIQLNVSTIKPGSYFIKVMNESGSASTIFNKQ
jgi:hypothetical protein